MTENTTPEIIKKIPIVGMDGQPLTEEQADATAPVPFQDFDLYQMLAEKSNVTPPENRLSEIMFGLAEEMGEFFSFHKRMVRGDYDTPEKQQEALYLASKELGDIMWYMSAWCTIHGLQFGEVPFQNIEKLSKRMQKNLVKGSGDTREEDTIEGESEAVQVPVSPVESADKE